MLWHIALYLYIFFLVHRHSFGLFHFHVLNTAYVLYPFHSFFTLLCGSLDGWWLAKCSLTSTTLVSPVLRFSRDIVLLIIFRDKWISYSQWWSGELLTFIRKLMALELITDAAYDQTYSLNLYAPEEWNCDLPKAPFCFHNYNLFAVSSISFICYR